MASKCQICKRNPREVACQPFGPDDDKTAFMALGHHYRGFAVFAICGECEDAIKRGDPTTVVYHGQTITFTETYYAQR